MAVVDFRGERFLSPPECFWNLREQKHCWHDDAVLGTVGLVDGGVDQVAAGAQHEVSRPFVLPVTDAIADADRPHARFRCPRLQFLRSFRHAELSMDTLHEAWRVDAGPDGDGVGRDADRPVYGEEHAGVVKTCAVPIAMPTVHTPGSDVHDCNSSQGFGMRPSRWKCNRG